MEATQEVNLGDAAAKDGAQVWARLVSMNPSVHPHKDITEKEITFGRKQNSTLRFTEASISNVHCRLYLDEDSGKKDPKAALVFLEDQSQNGTYVNGTRIGKGKRVKLNNGDEISLVIRNAEAAKDPKNTHPLISYLFTDQRNRQAKTVEDGGPEKLYDIREQLGEGAFATVYKCIHKQTGEQFALKKIQKSKVDNKESLMIEVRILQKVQHPNVISIKDVFETNDYLYLILELVSGGDLFDRVVEKKYYPEKQARELFRNLCLAIQYLHGEGIAHRDLKPENILMATKDDDVNIKVSDFGLSKVVGADKLLKTLCGTPQYLAPEILEKREGNLEGYSLKVDIWSMGVILYILLVGYPPFATDDFEVIRKADYNFNHSRWKAISNAAIDLVKHLLVADPEKRYGFEQIFDHPWMKGEEMAASAEPTPAPAATKKSGRGGKRKGAEKEKEAEEKAADEEVKKDDEEEGGGKRRKSARPAAVAAAKATSQQTNSKKRT